jgi:hypothetical protein
MDMRAGTQILPELLRGAQLTVLLAGPTFLRERAVAEAFLRAMLRGLRDLDRDGWGSPEHAAIIEQYTRVPASMVRRMLRQYGDPEGHVNWGSLQDQQRFFIERGYTTSGEPLDLLRYSEDGPRQAALQALGQYTPPGAAALGETPQPRN